MASHTCTVADQDQAAIGPAPRSPAQARAANDFCQRACRCLGPPTREAGEAGEDGVCLLEPNIGSLGAVASVPAQRSTPEPAGVVDKEED
jgi:hypothetical protein